jgi:putative ABC transport system permease protein
MYNWWDGIDYSAIYVPLRQAPPRDGVRVVLRMRGESADTAGNIKAAVAALDPLLAVDALKTMQQAIFESAFGMRFMASLIGISGAIALALSFIGIYSMMSYAVSQRTQEFGVRMALGATAGDVLRIALKQAGMLTTVGVTIGLALAAVLGYLMSSAIYGLVSLDPVIFAGVGGAVALVSLVGAYVPARRALAVDPAIVLRSQ